MRAVRARLLFQGSGGRHERRRIGPCGARPAGHAAELQGLAAGGRPAHAHEQPRSRGRRAARRSCGLRRRRQGGAQLGRPSTPSWPPCGAWATTRPCSCIGQAGRRLRHAPLGAARADRQRQPGRRLGQLGRVSPPRRPGPDHVRPDDGRIVDLHRHAGHPAGHLPDLRLGRRDPLRRRLRPRRPPRAHRRPRRHGRRPAAGGHHGRRRGALRRGRSGAHQAAPRDRLRRSARPSPRRGPALGGGGRATPSSRSPSACWATPPTSTPSSCAAASLPIWSPTRPRPTTP